MASRSGMTEKYDRVAVQPHADAAAFSQVIVTSNPNIHRLSVATQLPLSLPDEASDN